MGIELKEYWDNCHKSYMKKPESILGDDLGWFVSDYSGPVLWEMLNISHLIIAGKNLLEIGVGRGSNIKKLHDLGLLVYALDISPTALNEVKSLVQQDWLVDDISSLPKEKFDIICSNLVAQHMTGVDLLSQIKNVLPSLKKNGIFAMQFADRMNDTNYTETLENQMTGGVCRSVKCVTEIVELAGGKVTWEKRVADFPQYGSCWRVVHIVAI
jgi:2-polyprenyl-3-methyl-5-hydroxy-6-metoxy-1,4-benzoquinol methylase